MAAEFEAPEAAGDESERERAAAMELGFWLDRPQSADDNGTKTVEWEDAMFCEFGCGRCYTRLVARR